MIGIWNFVEGLGHPGMNTFVPVARRSTYPDSVATKFLDLASEFLRHGDSLDSYLDIALVDTIHMFRMMFRTTQHLLTEVELLQTRYMTLPKLKLDHLEVETDKIFNSIIIELQTELSSLCKAALDNSEILPPLALKVSIMGSELATELDRELARAQYTLNHLPWWDSWTVAHWRGRSPTVRYRAYLKFFQEEEQTFRALAAASLAIQDNILGLRTYCTWYTDDGTPTLINVDRHRDETLKPVTFKTIAQNIEYVQRS